jgi:uncharacterized membrane protein HdeD (DUF308 family)
MQHRFWRIEIVRGLLTLAFGIVFVMVPVVLSLFIRLLGVYLLADGCLDLFRIIRKKHTPQRHLSVYLGAAASGSIGLLSLIDPKLLLLLIGICFLLRLVVRGLQVFGEVRRWHGRFAGLYWLYGMVLLLLGFLCLLPAVIGFVVASLLLFVGIYILGDGLYILGYGLRLCFADRNTAEKVSPQAISSAVLDIPPAFPPTTRRVLIFVRRLGAAGLGHVGWAFEWKNGWFNVGSVENHGNHAFAAAGQADFWTAHTTVPVETILARGNAYDEYKVFFVSDPHPKEAWSAVVWVSQQPYRVVHRNCVDAVYDILRAYGLVDLPDPVTEYAPNDWYDSLAGRSYSVELYAKLPMHIRQFSPRPLAAREIVLAIPKTLPGTMPYWRTNGSGSRGLIEVTLVWQKMVHDVISMLTLLGRRIVRFGRPSSK